MSGSGGDGGGVSVTEYSHTKRFKKDFNKLDGELQDKAQSALEKLKQNPRPPGIRFEKLQTPPGVYTIHVTGNYKISMEIDGETAILRRIADHKTIDRCP